APAHSRQPQPENDRIDQANSARRARSMARPHPNGHLCFEFETDCTISSEYIMMMHFLDEIDDVLQEKLARYIRLKQRLDTHGGWPLYH
ncbi:hypothetical protein M1742_24710, partial [Salmonella enterica subsp. enterica serovar Typhimurium]|uniref:hypothetical protein n=1 Tax=Salmonella enterica TaxID=28901 RepID=UPI0021B3D2F0